MTYVHPQLITAHAPTIGAMHPTRNRDKDLADAIALEQIRSQNRIREIKAAQGGVVQPPTPSRKNRQVISVAETKADVFGKSVPGLRREIARIAPGGGMGVARSARGGDSDYKVTGTSIFNRPDDDSVWRDDLNQWIRPWLPGEKEAEALRRTGEVQNELAEERELTAQGRRERAALVEDVVNSIKAGKFSREELPALMEQFGLAKEELAMADSLREREPTAQEQLDKRRVILDGIPGIYDSKGNFVPSSSFRDTSEQKQMDYDLRREELAAKRLDSQRTNANKMITDLMKPVKTGKDNRGNDTFRAMSYEEALEIAKKAYPDVYNPPAASQEAPAGSGMADPVIAARTDAPVPTTEATAEPTPTEDDDEFAKFRRK